MAVWGTALCQEVRAPLPLSYFSISFSLIMCLFTVPGNLLVCWAIFKNPNNDLRTPFTTLILNLAVADLIVGALVEPLSVQYHMQEALRAPSTKDLIKTLHMGFFISSTASVFALGGLTLDRYLAITSPVWYRVNVSYKRVFIISIMVWLCAVSLSLLYLNFGYANYGFIFVNTVVLGTISVLIFCYIGIFKKLRLQVLQLDLIHDNSRENRAKQRAIMREKTLTRTYFLMLGVFLICFVPSCAAMYIVNLCSTCDCNTIHCLRDVHLLFVLLSSCVNPIVYGWRLPNLRRAFVSYILTTRCSVVIQMLCVVSPSRFQKARLARTKMTLPRRLCWEEDRLKHQNVVANCLTRFESPENMTD